MLAAITSFAVLCFTAACWDSVWTDWRLRGGGGVHGLLPPWAVVLAFALKSGGGLYIHAERLLAKAGGSKCKLRGIPTLGT